MAPCTSISRRSNRWLSGCPGIGVKRAITLFEEKGILGRLSFKRLLRKIFPKMSHLKMQDSQRSSQHLIMTSTSNSPFFGPPPPIIELTMEQDLKMSRIEDLLPEAEKDDIITVFLALQKQNFVLSNTVNQSTQEMAESPAHYTRGTIEVWDFIPRPATQLSSR